MRKLRVFYTRKLGRFVGRCVGLLGVLFLIVNLISCQDDFQENVEPPVTPPEETVTPPVYMLLNGKYKSGVNLTLHEDSTCTIETTDADPWRQPESLRKMCLRNVMYLNLNIRQRWG